MGDWIVEDITADTVDPPMAEHAPSGVTGSICAYSGAFDTRSSVSSNRGTSSGL
jgi:hypothetical protein